MSAGIGGGVNRVAHLVERDSLPVGQIGSLDLAVRDLADRTHPHSAAGFGRRHSIVLPPLTLMTCPVTNDASGEARYATMEATSAISAGRPIGMTSTYFCTACGALAIAFFTFSVATMHGDTTLKVTPSVANSRASPVVIPCTPPFAALYPAWFQSPF